MIQDKQNYTSSNIFAVFDGSNRDEYSYIEFILIAYMIYFRNILLINTRGEYLNDIQVKLVMRDKGTVLKIFVQNVSILAQRKFSFKNFKSNAIIFAISS